MVDNLDGDLARFGLVERPAHRTVQTAPGRFVDLGPERPLELVVGFLRTSEVCVTHKEALAVVIGVDEPAGNVVGGSAANLPGGRIVDIYALDFGDDPILPRLDLHIRLTENHEEVARA